MPLSNNKFILNLLVLLTIFLSGNNLILKYLVKEISFSILLLLYFIFFYKQKFYISKVDYIFFITFSLILIFHYFRFGDIVLLGSIGFCVTFLIAFYNIKAIKNFTEIYVNIMTVLSLISLFFYFFYYFFNFKIGIQISEISTHNFLYHYKNEDLSQVRNSGPFWEPGAFSGYLILALFFILRDLRNKKTLVTSCILIATILTTRSTTGYIALAVIMLIYLIQEGYFKFSKTNFLRSFFFIFLFYLATYYTFTEVQFLRDKILLQNELVFYEIRNFQSTRLGNFYYDLEFIKQSPFFGISANIDIRSIFDTNAADITSGQGNSLSGFTVRFGIIGLLTLIIIFCYYSYKKNKSIVLSFNYLILICILLFSQKYLNFPLFYTLFFINNDNDNNEKTRT